jgi:protein-S-isoprenylcysteine O-methyltransferase Ste14
MRRVAAIVGSLIFLLLAPGTVAGFVPWWISRWQFHTPFSGYTAFRIAGIVLIAGGASMLLDSFVRFAIHGLGTPAPVFPTRHLVVTGLYRYVRNPMYVGIVSVILGQGLLLGDCRVLIYGALIWFAFHLFVLAYEEPKLRRSFGIEYQTLCANVPRWIPRMQRWRG